MRPNSKDTYKRLMVLKYLIIHSYSSITGDDLKRLSEHWTDSEKEKFDIELQKRVIETVSSIKSFGLWEFATQNEKDVLSSTGSQMDSVSQKNATWKMEAAIILMWALKLVGYFPDINKQTNPELLKTVETKKLGLFSNSPSLRTNEEIDKMRDIIELWHWRINTRRLIENNYNFVPDENMKKAGINSLDDIIKKTAKSAYANGDIKEIIDDDFVFKGQPFRDLTQDDFSEATSIIIERHFALNWLCGYAPNNNWDETPTDT